MKQKVRRRKRKWQEEGLCDAVGDFPPWYVPNGESSDAGATSGAKGKGQNLCKYQPEWEKRAAWAPDGSCFIMKGANKDEVQSKPCVEESQNDGGEDRTKIE